MFTNEPTIKELQEKIKELEESLSMEIMVKKSEVMLNKELKERIEKQELHLETLLKINEDYSDKIARLRKIIKDIINK